MLFLQSFEFSVKQLQKRKQQSKKIPWFYSRLMVFLHFFLGNIGSGYFFPPFFVVVVDAWLEHARASCQEQWMIDQYDLTAPLHTETNSCLIACCFWKVPGFFVSRFFPRKMNHDEIPKRHSKKKIGIIE